jgi:hypothetical protein
VVGRAPEHATLPERRTPRGEAWGRIGGLSDAAQEAPDLLEIGDKSQESHAAVAGGTAASVLIAGPEAGKHRRDAVEERLARGPGQDIADTLLRLGCQAIALGRA